MTDQKSARQTSVVLVALFVAWICGLTLLQWILHGPYVDLDKLAGLSLNLALHDLSVHLRELLAPPLGS